MHLKLKEDPRDWRKFTFALTAAASLGGYVAYRRHLLGATGLMGLVGTAAAVAVLCLVQPRWFRGVYRAGMTLGFHFGQVVSRVMLTGMFFLIVTPLGWFLRLSGKDLLRLKRNPEARSYWQPAKPNPNFDRLF